MCAVDRIFLFCDLPNCITSWLLVKSTSSYSHPDCSWAARSLATTTPKASRLTQFHIITTTTCEPPCCRLESDHRTCATVKELSTTDRLYSIIEEQWTRNLRQHTRRIRVHQGLRRSPNQGDFTDTVCNEENLPESDTVPTCPALPSRGVRELPNVPQSSRLTW